MSDFERQFSAVEASKLLLLNPSSAVCNEDVLIDIPAAVEMYKTKIPSVELMDQGIKKWKSKWLGNSINVHTSCAHVVKQYDEREFPNIIAVM